MPVVMQRRATHEKEKNEIGYAKVNFFPRKKQGNSVFNDYFFAGPDKKIPPPLG
jgi:hypothetical protein